MEDQIKKLEARVKELEKYEAKVKELEKYEAKAKELEKIEAKVKELEALNEEKDRSLLAKKSGLVIVPGHVELNLEDAKTGKKKKVKLGIADNYPNISINPGMHTVVDSACFMKKAMGQKLSEEEAALYPALVEKSAEDCKNYLASMYQKGSGFIKVL